MRAFAIFALAVTLPLSCAAQRGGTGGFHGGAPAGRAPSHRFPSAGSFAVGRGAYASRFNRYSPYGSLLLPFLGDAYDLDDLYASGFPVASQPPMIPLETALALAGSRRGMSGAFDREPSPAEPLMIELKDGQYVRVSGEQAGGELQTLPVESQPERLAGSTASSAAARELASAVLVFRDGHSEEVRDYTIANGILYAHGDFYTDGYWNKQINLASLNLPETVQANASRNVNFALPSSPNEVIARF